MNLIERSHCIVTQKQDLEPLYSFKDFPVFLGCTDQPASKDIRADMSWAISREAGMVQLNKLVPLEVLYPESHGSGCIGRVWDQHHKEFAAFVHKRIPSSVFEIGGAHGILAREYQTYGDVPWTILEPNPTPIEGNKAKFIKGFFDDKFVLREEFDAVVHSHVFEHIYKPDQFLAHLSRFMDSGKRLMFSIPNMRVMLERKYNNCLDFEHTAFLTEPYIEFMLAKHGFCLMKTEYFLEDHSIFYDCVRDAKVKPIDLPPGLYKGNKRIYLDYIAYHKKLIDDLNKKIRASEHPVYLFGAHVFAQYLLAFGLDESCIVCLLDNDSKKQGRRLYGTNLQVQSPKTLRDVRNASIILKAGVYNDEIRRDILENINASATFLE